MIFFTSDLHFGHQNAIKFTERPFEDVDDMNNKLIENWNNKVGKDDTVYVLGDFAYRTREEQVRVFYKQLNGKKILIRGNHDKKWMDDIFEEVYDFKEIFFNGYCFSLMHYPMVEWPKSRYGSIHCHGHQHNHMPYNEHMKRTKMFRYDVGVDANNFVPISILDVLKFFDLPEYNEGYIG